MFQMVPIIALLALAAAFAARVCQVYRLRVARRQGETGGRPKSQLLTVDGCLVKPVQQSQPRDALSSAWSRRSVAALAAHVERHAWHAPDHSPARVLVADDNTANRNAAVRMLESLGLRADASANAAEALEMVRLFPYDLVLMDCQMPSRNGQAAAIEIRKREPPGRHTPVVAMTAETGMDCLDDCLASGMDDILLKPVRREQLMATLRRWLPAGREKRLPVGGAAGG